MKTIKLLLGVCLVAVLAGACKRDYFDENIYREQLKQAFPVDSIDMGHDWRLTQVGKMTVTAAGEGVQRVQILNANPLTTATAEIVDEAYVTEGQTVSMTYVVPKTLQEVYVGAVGADSRYCALKQVAVGETSVDLSDAVMPLTSPKTIPAAQSFFYCFEEDYPYPGDWDFNDMVLKLSKVLYEDQVAAATTVQLDVTLEALGTTEQLAAAIRLAGISYDDIESVTTIKDYSFVTNKDVARFYIEDDATLLKSRNGEAVINLFDDGHLAFYKKLNSMGQVNRWIFNTSITSGDDVANWSGVTVSFLIKFKSEEAVRAFSLNDVDPFIVKADNILWEIHTYRFKFDEVLIRYYDGNSQTYDDGYSWAIEIPYSNFAYPWEGNVMGQLKNTIILGAYRTRGHSFGEWLLDHEKALDWYRYPSPGETYY